MKDTYDVVRLILEVVEDGADNEGHDEGRDLASPEGPASGRCASVLAK